METTVQNKSKSFTGIKSAGLVILACLVIAILIFHFVFGNPSNFMNNDPNNHPLIKEELLFRLFKLCFSR